MRQKKHIKGSIIGLNSRSQDSDDLAPAKSLISSLFENKQWLFSGVAIFAVSLIIGGVVGFFSAWITFKDDIGEANQKLAAIETKIETIKEQMEPYRLVADRSISNRESLKQVNERINEVCKNLSVYSDTLGKVEEKLAQVVIKQELRAEQELRIKWIQVMTRQKFIPYLKEISTSADQ